MEMDPNLIEVNEITDILSFLKSIDWTNEFWLVYVGIFHISISVLCFFISLNLQVILFSLLCKYSIYSMIINLNKLSLLLVVLVYFSEFLNELAAKNSYRFAKQQYFDSNGLFISIIFCSPILINCIFILARWLMLSYELITKVKTAQLKEKVRRHKEISKKSN